MKVLFAGGGTGGHLFPALAVAEELLKRDATTQFLFVGSNRGLEARLIPARGFAFEAVSSGALKGMPLAVKTSTVFSMPRSARVASRMVRQFSPDVVVGIGGYASGPALLAAVIDGRPILLMEQNVVPGLANRIIAYFANGAAVTFEESARFFPGNAVTTGNPVRQEFFQIGSPSSEKFTILIFGGSQGAHAINRAMVEALPRLVSLHPQIQFIHQTGEKDFEAVREAYAGNELVADVGVFFDDMPAQFERAHLVIGRSGASTLSEIAATARPSILVPLPTAADDHQHRNAEVFVARGAAAMLEQSTLTGDRMAETIQSLFASPQRREMMSRAAATLAVPDAAARIADLVERSTGSVQDGRH
jgi:UDP-N-acetylglucosamine--N-acetylmuramyl-(pentapeptide) pyrophosphoryl-undecaprenol N-acetylglucosamine transferase